MSFEPKDIDPEEVKSRMPSKEQLPGPGRLPLRPGVLMTKNPLHEQLKVIGWADGDPVPPDMAQLFAQVSQEYTEDLEKARAALIEQGKAAPRPAKPTLIKIADLPPDKRAILEQRLAEYKQDVAVEEAAAAANAPALAIVNKLAASGAHPSVLSAAMAAANLQQSAAAAPDVERAMPKPREGSNVAGMVGDFSGVAAMEGLKAAAAKLEQPPTEEPPSEAPPSTGADKAEVYCQRCLHKAGDPVPTLSREDKEQWLAMFLGRQSFRKRMPVFNNLVSADFRTPTVKEEALCQAQMGKHVFRGETRGDIDYLGLLLEYRFVLGTERIDVGGNVIYEAKPLDKLIAEFTPKAAAGESPTHVDTCLPALRTWFYENILVQEPVRRAYAQAYRDFGTLAVNLEAAALRPDFCEGITRPGSWSEQQPTA